MTLSIKTDLPLNNGVNMPAFGFGVFQTSPEDTVTSVRKAIEAGYRLIDTAAVYGNEREVGEAIRQSGVVRGELFVTTKLWTSEYGHTSTLKGYERSLNKLGLDHVDLYLMHWPLHNEFDLTIESYKAIETLASSGKVRAIGVSNFSADHLDRLIDETTIVPAVNQIELHPYFNQTAMRDYHAARGIVTQAWSPLGAVNIYESEKNGSIRHLREDPVVNAIAETHAKSAAQIVLRWHLQHGISVIPKSVHPTRIVENADIFDFELSAAEISRIDDLDTGVRAGYAPEQGTREQFSAVISD